MCCTVSTYSRVGWQQHSPSNSSLIQPANEDPTLEVDIDGAVRVEAIGIKWTEAATGLNAILEGSFELLEWTEITHMRDLLGAGLQIVRLPKPIVVRALRAYEIGGPTVPLDTIQ
jgi:hypothetical protein